MYKDFLPYDKVRNNSLKMAHKIYTDGFIPDVIYVSLRGGAYVANVVSEYFKIVRKDIHPVYFAAVVARSYTDIRENSQVMVDGWTYSPDYLRHGDKILLIDDIFDTGNTINYLVNLLLEKGIPRKDIKVAVHDYKYFTYKEEQLPIQPDYWCRKFVINKPEEDLWIHYMSHELIGLSKEELEEHYYKDDPELKAILDPLLGK
ncbi:MAG: phosphoribosyltransferase family protein [Treponemataceae bacterium]|nr:phosphoribosyltransferase family protein [Spirochaetales bacterium]MDY6031958.1 phosphoribosyltransferase family protein [Treponemataceae bacterium]